MLRSRTTAPIARLLAVAVLSALVLTASGPMAIPASVAAGTFETMESTILGWVNVERSKRGLAPLRLHPALVDLAGDRATTMATTGVFKHPDCVRCMFDNRGIQYFSGTEIIAWTGYGAGSTASKSLYDAWRNSSLHWGILMSSKYNYIGLGVADKSATRGTQAAGLLTESVDQTKPWAKMGSASRSGTTIKWTWYGADNRLQTHTAGLKNFVVQYRVDGGTWRTVRTGTTAKSLSMTDRARGHCYALRVQSRDNRGILSNWTTAVRVCVP